MVAASSGEVNLILQPECQVLRPSRVRRRYLLNRQYRIGAVWCRGFVGLSRAIQRRRRGYLGSAQCRFDAKCLDDIGGFPNQLLERHSPNSPGDLFNRAWQVYLGALLAADTSAYVANEH